MTAQRSQRICADLESTAETFSGGGAVVTDQLLLAGEGEAMHQAIKNAPICLDLGKHRLHLVRILNIQGQEE